MSAMAFQVTGVSIVCSTVCSGTDHRKHQGSVSLAFVGRTPHKGPITRKMFPLNDAIMFDSWWRHQMETFSALLPLCEGNSPVTGEFPSQRPVTRSFGVFIDLRLYKQSGGWWFETPSRSLWRHYNVESSMSDTDIALLTQVKVDDHACAKVPISMVNRCHCPSTPVVFTEKCPHNGRSKYV